MKRNLFTLIELLVVISIIGILSSILMPSLSKAREKARMAICVNNLKQISVASMVYGSEENESMPVYKTGPGSSHSLWGKDKLGLERALADYIDAEVPSANHLATGHPIFMCPSSPVRYEQSSSKYVWIEGSNSGYSTNTYEGLYYHYNASVANSGLDEPSQQILKKSSYVNPSQHPYQWCSRRHAPVWGELDGSGWNNLLAASSWHSRNDMGPRPTVFLDSHVKILKRAKYTRHGGQDIMQSGSTMYYNLLKHVLDEY